MSIIQNYQNLNCPKAYNLYHLSILVVNTVKNLNKGACALSDVKVSFHQFYHYVVIFMPTILPNAFISLQNGIINI